MLRRKQTISERRLRIRRACALGRNPRRRMASSTRVRVFRLTWELEFSTREIVPMPTPAARATSRIVVFVGTASIAIGVLVAFAPRLRFAGQRPRSFSLASLTHPRRDDSQQCAWPALPALLARSQKSDPTKSFFQDFDLTCTFCSVRVWNQFQSRWSFLEASGVCDEKTVCFLFRLDA